MQEVRIPFKGWDLVAWVNEHDREHLIAVRPIAEAIGVQWARQAKRLQNDPRFTCVHMCTPSAGGPQEMLCIPVKQINGWLYSINANKVKPELREKLLQFQEECHIALHDHMSGRANARIVEMLKQMNQELQETNRALWEHVAMMQAEHSKEISGLRASIEHHDYMLGIEVSAAGRRLAHSKKLRVVQ
jgi:hypothetical protein